MPAFGTNRKNRSGQSENPASAPSSYRKRIGSMRWSVVRCLVVLMLAVCNGCKDTPPVYEAYREIARASWESDTPVSFTFAIDDATAAYRLTLIVRNDRRYPYRNLWVAGVVERPEPADRDTTEYVLADENGKWLGNGFSVFTHQFPFRENYVFPDTGTYTVRFGPLMTDPVLPGIRRIGLRVEKVQPDTASLRQPAEAPGIDSAAATGFSGK